jgi:small subunit ribosomal protein S9
MKAATYIAVGRRKKAVARVRLSQGEGNFLVNKRPLLDFFKREVLKMVIEQPLELTETLGKYDIYVNVSGGGLSGQAGAVRLGVARALIKAESELRGKLKAEGMLTRDPRMVERKKYGQPKARKRFQFSKR